MDMIKISSITLDVILFVLLCRMVYDREVKSNESRFFSILPNVGARVISRERPVNIDIPEGYPGIPIPRGSFVSYVGGVVCIIWNDMAITLADHDMKRIVLNALPCKAPEWNGDKHKPMPIWENTTDPFESDPDPFHDIFEEKMKQMRNGMTENREEMNEGRGDEGK